MMFSYRLQHKDMPVLANEQDIPSTVCVDTICSSLKYLPWAMDGEKKSENFVLQAKRWYTIHDMYMYITHTHTSVHVLIRACVCVCVCVWI